MDKSRVGCGYKQNAIQTFNFILIPAGALSGNLGEVLIRCNNVLYIHGVDEEDEEGEMKD